MADVRDEAGCIIGGVYGELAFDWLYVDLLWVDEAFQGRGYGRRLMQSIEHEALQRGTGVCYLATTSFQSLPFYHHIGYRLFGVLEDRPPGYHYYFLHKQIEPQAPDLHVIDDPEPPDIETIRKGLSGHNERKGVVSQGKRLAVFFQDGTNGGIIAATYWGWLDIQLMWVRDRWRGQRHGTKLLQIAENEAHARGCLGAYVDVIDFQAVSFFEQHGYRTFGMLQDRPKGHVTHFMQKNLNQLLR